MTSTAKIRRQGGAMVFSIPPALLKMLGAEVGTELTLAVDNGSLVATPKIQKKRYTLAELLEGADEMAEHLRAGLNRDEVADYRDLFTHVYAEPTPQLREQQALIADELSREEAR